MLQLPKYIETNKDLIKNLPAQPGFDWKIKYQNYKDDTDVEVVFDLFSDRCNNYDAYDNKKINRAIVREIFLKQAVNNRVKLISAMIWGGIDTGRFGNYFQRMQNMNHQTVIKIVDHIQNLLKAGNVLAAFNSLETTHRLDGIGHAFHTKLLYFLGDSILSLSPKPLIFDLRTKNAYCAMLVEIGDPRHKQFFSSARNIVANNPYVDVKTGQLSNAYDAYITDMDDWAKQIGVLSWQLEQFLFGWHLNHRSPYPGISTNPRIDIKNILIQRAPPLVNPTVQIGEVEDDGLPPLWELRTGLNGSSIYFSPTAWLPWNEIPSNANSELPERLKKRKLVFELYRMTSRW